MQVFGFLNLNKGLYSEFGREEGIALKSAVNLTLSNPDYSRECDREVARDVLATVDRDDEWQAVVWK